MQKINSKKIDIFKELDVFVTKQIDGKQKIFYSSISYTDDNKFTVELYRDNINELSFISDEDFNNKLSNLRGWYSKHYHLIDAINSVFEFFGLPEQTEINVYEHNLKDMINKDSMKNTIKKINCSTEQSFYVFSRDEVYNVAFDEKDIAICTLVNNGYVIRCYAGPCREALLLGEKWCKEYSDLNFSEILVVKQNKDNTNEVLARYKHPLKKLASQYASSAEEYINTYNKRNMPITTNITIKEDLTSAELEILIYYIKLNHHPS